MSPTGEVKPMYPGVYPPAESERELNYPTAPLNSILGFDLETYQVPLEHLLPSKKVPEGITTTRKYKQIVSSIREIGLIEPLSVIQTDAAKTEFILLDGNLRALALNELGMSEAPCLLAKDDETYTYNHRINRLSTVQEHYMIRRAIDRGVSKERLARAFDVNLSSINRRVSLLEGICPKAIELLKDRQFAPDLTRSLRSMKSARQIEAVELMLASNSLTVAHAQALLQASPPEQRTDRKSTKTTGRKASLEQITKLEKEMKQVHVQYQDAEKSYSSDLLNLVAVKSYLSTLLENESVKSYINKNDPEILVQIEKIVQTTGSDEEVSPEEN